MKRCSICGVELKSWEDDICENCQASIIINGNIEPSLDDLE